MSEQLSVVGKRLARADALEKVKGEAKFPSDIKLAGMLYAKFLRSPHAHARIAKIDTTKAEALPGVKCILTHKNVPRVHPLQEIPGFKKFEYLLDETVHYAGEEVAAIAAVAPEIAEEALKLIEVEYEVLPAVFDKEEAIKPGAPLAHRELGSNLSQCPRAVDGMLSLEGGDVNKGFAEADYIVEGTYESPFQHPVSPEPRSVLCQWVAGKLICWTSTQIPQKVRLDLSACLGIPLSSIRVISTYSVGGYGGKEPEKTATLTALLAKKTGRPVKVVFARAEDFIGTHRRIDAKFYARLGVKLDGTITALYTKVITNFGRDSKFAHWIPASVATHACTALYRYQNSKWEGYHVITNIPDHGPMIGLGAIEGAFCIERLIDEAAERLGMDPVEFRLKNCARYGDKGIDAYSVVSGPIKWSVLGPDIDSLQECIRRVAEKACWKEKWKGWHTPMEVRGAKRRGIGIAIAILRSGGFGDSSIVKLNQDGTADVLSSDPEMGQGLKTAMAQVVAEVLGLQHEDINVILADTSVTPHSRGAVGQRGTSSGINAAYLAAQDAKRKLFEIAATKLGVKVEALEAKDRRIYAKDNKSKGISVAESCLAGYQITGTAVLPYPWRDERTGKEIYPVSVAATIAEVEVDTETGALEVLRLASAHDCGRAINPQIVENQINLSMVMGNGWVRSEEYIIDKRLGVVLNSNMLDYKLMTILDMPKRDDIQEIIVEFPTPWGPFGAKGMSETAVTTQAPAIANAIYNAIGTRIRGDHCTPDKILEALRRK